jgi:DNA end-binding protein Ku
VPDDEVVRVYEVAKGEVVPVTDEDFAAAEAENLRTIAIEDFVPYDQIDPIYFERTYFLGPDEGAEHVYAVLMRAMEDSGLAAIGRYVFHKKEHLGLLRVREGVITLERMYFADEVRDADGVLPGKKHSVDKRELKLAIDLIERMQGTFDHSAYHDRYRDRLMAIIDKKRKGETITVPEAQERKAPSDLLAALEASLGEAVGRRKAQTAKRKPAAKSPAKSTAKRTPASARKAAPKKPKKTAK